MSATVAVVLMNRICGLGPSMGETFYSNRRELITMTIFINEAKDLATSITTKESEIAHLRNSLDIENDRIGLIIFLALEANKRNILISRQGRKKDAGEYKDLVCFEVCGQTNTSGTGKKLAENAQKFAKHHPKLGRGNRQGCTGKCRMGGHCS